MPSSQIGCGDGNFLSMLKLPAYVGVDVSSTTLARCAERFAASPNYQFILPDRLNEVVASELALSIDVIYHLVEDTVFEQHMARLFGPTTRFVIIYASNINKSWPDQHVRHRRFGDHVAKRWPNWRLLAHVPNPYPYDPKRADTTSFADFFVYGRTGESCAIRLPSV